MKSQSYSPFNIGSVSIREPEPKSSSISTIWEENKHEAGTFSDYTEQGAENNVEKQVISTTDTNVAEKKEKEEIDVPLLHSEFVESVGHSEHDSIGSIGNGLQWSGNDDPVDKKEETTVIDTVSEEEDNNESGCSNEAVLGDNDTDRLIFASEDESESAAGSSVEINAQYDSGYDGADEDDEMREDRNESVSGISLDFDDDSALMGKGKAYAWRAENEYVSSDENESDHESEAEEEEKVIAGDDYDLEECDASHSDGSTGSVCFCSIL